VQQIYGLWQDKTRQYKKKAQSQLKFTAGIFIEQLQPPRLSEHFKKCSFTMGFELGISGTMFDEKTTFQALCLLAAAYSAALGNYHLREHYSTQ